MARVVCAFASPADGRRLAAEGIDRCRLRDGELVLVAALGAGRFEPAGPLATQRIRRLWRLTVELARLAERAQHAGVAVRTTIVASADAEREGFLHAVAEGADTLLVLERPGLLRRLRGAESRVRRISFRASRRTSRLASAG